MFTIDMTAIRPVGEFGSEAWCQACADYGTKILEQSDLPPDLSWGFSEIYTYPPERLISPARIKSGYHFMIREGEISGGDGVPDSCLELSGFHAKLRWAYICNQSASTYGSAGQKQRARDEKTLREEIASYTGIEPDMGGVPNPVWPKPIIAAVSAGAEEGMGLHNIAASLQTTSPEFSGLPTTVLGVPDFSRMSDQQKLDFIDLCGLKTSATS